MPGTLYLIPVEIADGTLPGVLPPATLKTLFTLRHFLVENAKSARAFLSRAGYPFSLRETDIREIGHRPSPELCGEWLRNALQGADIGILSESGCPAVADPGAEVVRAAHGLGLRVVPLVGPSAILLTLMASGLCGQRFSFVGYLPVGETERAREIARLERLSGSDQTQLLIETPYRNNQVFEALLNTLSPDTSLCVAQDVTGQEEFICTKTAAQWKKARPELKKLPTVFAFKAPAVRSRPRKGFTGS